MIIVEPFAPDGPPEVFVQWFGEADGGDVTNLQFRFPVPLSPDHAMWMNHPEKFKVILVGQVKDWPKPSAQEAVAASAKGTLETWILWICSSHYTVQHSNGPGPACCVVPLTAMLGDPNVGVITPRKYCDLSVLKEESKKV